MSSDHLKSLIQQLETERDSLQRLIDQAVKEEEYLHAHFHFEAIAQINRQLNTLKNLDDEWYEKKQMLEHTIKRLREHLELRPESKLNQTISSQIEAHEKELAQLNRIPEKEEKKNETTQLKNSLELFVKNKIRGLRIIFKNVDHLAIEIRHTSGGAKLTISDTKKLQSEYVLNEEGMLKLKAMGFLENNKGDKMTAMLLYNKSILFDKIRSVMAVIVFEVFYFRELGKEAVIEILKRKTSE